MSNNTPPNDEINPSRRLPEIVIEVNGESLNLHPADVTVPEINQELRDRIESAHTVVFRDWEIVPTLPDTAAQEMISLAATQGHIVEIHCKGQVLHDPFQAMLSMSLDRRDLTQVARVTACAITAAALCHPGAAAAAADSIKQWCNDHNVRSDRCPSIAKQIRDAAGEAAVPDKPTPQQLADVVLARMQTERAMRGEDPSICPPKRFWMGNFYVWDGTFWSLLDEPETKVVRKLQAEAEHVPLTTATVKSVLLNIKAKTHLPAAKAPVYVCSEQPLETRERQVLVCNNCVLDFDQQNVFPHDPRLFATMRIPHDHDPSAACPLWLQTLEDIFPRQSAEDYRIEVLQEYIGYSLMPWDHRQQKFMILHGGGDNGKSTILRVIRHLLGSENVSEVPLNAFGKEFYIGQMNGKYANIADDMPRMEKVHEGLLKQLISGEPTVANRKNKDMFTMLPTAKLYFACNNLPPIADTSYGMWRRMMVLPFTESFSDRCRRDPNRPQRLQAEVSGILNWALAGAIRLRDQGHFTDCAVCDQQQATYRLESDPFLQFVDECCVTGPEASAACGDLYSAYRDFCEEAGRKAKCSSEFGKQAKAMDGVRKTRPGGPGRRPWFYEGIGLARGVAAQNARRRIREEGSQG